MTGSSTLSLEATRSRLLGSSVENALRVGDRVLIAGLRMRPDLEGRAGVIVDWAEPEQRWRIQLCRGGPTKLLLPEHLLPCATQQASCLDGVVSGGADEGASRTVRPDTDAMPKDPIAADSTRRPGRARSGRRGVTKGGRGAAVRVQTSTSTVAIPVVDRQPTTRQEVMMTPSPLEPEHQAATSLAPENPVRSASIESIVEQDQRRCMDTLEQEAHHVELEAGVEHEQDNAVVSGEALSPVEHTGSPATRLPVGACPSPGSPLSVNPTAATASGRPSDNNTATNLTAGTRVCVVGLDARPEVNGQQGTVLEHLEHEARWRIVLPGGLVKILRAENLRPLEFENLSQPADVAIVAQGGSDVAGRATREFQIGSRVRVRGIAHCPELEGLAGTLYEIAASADTSVSGSDRWKVVMDNGPRLNLGIDNLQLLVSAPASFESCGDEAGPQLECPPVGEGVAVSSLADASIDQAMVSPPATTMDACLVVGAHVRVVRLPTRPDLEGLDGVLVAFLEQERRWKVQMYGGMTKIIRPANLEVV